jgi:DnaK suppressor protein
VSVSQSPAERERILEASRAALARRLVEHQGTGLVCGDPADVAEAVAEAELGEMSEARARELLEQTERALARLRAGQDDVCAGCGATIAPARREALPRTTVCVDCARAGRS